MATIAERLREALNIRGMKQAELVEKTGIGKSSISTYLSGEYEPKQRNIYKIAQALNVSEAWLIGFDVPMQRETPQKPVSPQKDNEELHNLIDMLDSIDQAEIKGTVKQMLRAEKYAGEKANLA